MKKMLNTYLSGGSILLLAIFLVNVINFAFNAYLGRVLSFESFGLVALINTMWYVTAIVLTALTVTVTQQSAYLIAQKGIAAGSEFLQRTNQKVLLIALGISVLWILMIPLTNSFFQIHDFLIPLLFTPSILLGALVASNKGFLQGNFNFIAFAIIVVLEAISKLVLAWFFVSTNLEHWVYTAIPLSIGVSFVLAFFITSKKTKKEKVSESYAFPKRFFTAALVTGFASMAFLTFDVLLAKHYLLPAAAGQYALLALIGKMVYFFGSLPAALIITYVSKARGKNANPQKDFYKLLIATVVLSVGGFLGLGLFGAMIVPFLLGEKTMVILPYLLQYSAAIALLTISGSLISYHLAKQQYFFPLISIVMALCMSLGIMFYHNTISEITSVLFVVSVMSFFLVALLHVLELYKVPVVMKYLKVL